MTKVLLITGQTATGKTSFAVEVAHKFNGELVSADSRQVYQGMDIITGKDKDKIDVPIWLYDLVRPDEQFSVSQWRQKALEAIQDISARGKLPIVVGGTGLYLRSLTENLDTVNIPPDPNLRTKLSSLSVSDLFAQLVLLEPSRANSLNNSDKNNTRRLIRAIEIALFNKKTQYPLLRLRGGLGGRYLSIVLTCSPDLLKVRISDRVHQRIAAGANSEFTQLTSFYSPDSEIWINNEYQYARRQLGFFNKYFPKNHFDISNPLWRQQVLGIMDQWTNT